MSMIHRVRDTPSEAEIHALIAHGQLEKAIAKAWDAYGKKIGISCKKRLSRLLGDLGAGGEDVVQEVFIAFYCSLTKKTYNPLQGTVYDYLLGITTNCVTNTIRTVNKSIRNCNAAFFELKHSAHTDPY